MRRIQYHKPWFSEPKFIIKQAYRLRVGHRTSIYALEVEGDLEAFEQFITEVPFGMERDRGPIIIARAENLELSGDWARIEIPD